MKLPTHFHEMAVSISFMTRYSSAVNKCSSHMTSRQIVNSRSFHRFYLHTNRRGLPHINCSKQHTLSPIRDRNLSVLQLISVTELLLLAVSRCSSTQVSEQSILRVCMMQWTCKKNKNTEPEPDDHAPVYSWFQTVNPVLRQEMIHMVSYS